MTTPTMDDQIKHVESLMAWFVQLPPPARKKDNEESARTGAIYQAILETLRKVKAEQDLLHKMSESFGGES